MAAEPLHAEEQWQQIACRLCQHIFAVPVTGDMDEAVDLCQVCTVLVERYGKRTAPDEATPNAGALNTPAPRRAPRAEGKEPKQADLDSLRGRGPTGWAQEQHTTSREARLPRARRREGR